MVNNIIIGFGKGGKTLARDLARRGEEVVVVEESRRMYGGTCINIGCIPSKSLILNGASGMPFSEAAITKTALTDKLRAKNYHMIADQESATVIDGRARFVSDHEIEITMADGTIKKMRGERIFINTGAKPLILPIPGLSNSQHLLDSTAAMDLQERPNELIIIGAGYIGLEFASMFASYGTKVVVLDSKEKFLEREDDDISDAIYNDLLSLGIEFHLGVNVEQVIDIKQGVEISFSEGGERYSVSGDYVLAATGRTPNTSGLGLENTGIAVGNRGEINVDDQLHTTVENVWALGDVKGGPQFTYISLDDYRIVWDELFGAAKRRVSDRTNVPTSVFLTPPLSAVGLSEKSAKQSGKNYRLFKMAAASAPKSHVARETRGLFKVLVDPDTDLILGASLYALESHELINLVALAMNTKTPYTTLRDQIFSHPTMGEAFNDLLS